MEGITEIKSRPAMILQGIFYIFLLLILIVFSRWNYLFFHTVAEFFSISIAFALFFILWNSIKYFKSSYFIIIGISYFFIGIIDILHLITFKGMNIFKGDIYYTTQLWIAARYLESFVLMVSPLFVKPGKKINHHVYFTFSFAITTLAVLSIFVWKIFPECFIKGSGLTPFKVYSEYIICLFLLVSLFTLNKVKSYFNANVLKYLNISIICTIISELSFTIYKDNYDYLNMTGHIFKIISFYFIYKSVITKAILEPQEIIFREIIQTKDNLLEQNSALKNQAVVDPLTGLYNRRFINECIEKEIIKSSRDHSKFSVILIDADYFKKINDSYGHITGDEILKELSGIFRNSVRQTDTAGRYGGEEFIIMLPGTDIEKGYCIAEKIRGTVASKIFSSGIRMTVSIGVTEYNGESISDFIDKADKHLYCAKNNGRNRVEI